VGGVAVEAETQLPEEGNLVQRPQGVGVAAGN